MIVDFSVENYLSFKDRVTVDFQAGSIKEYKENTFYASYNQGYNLVKSVGIFGHNASGKSNLIKAVSFMKEFVLNSSKESNSTQEIKAQPFLLSTLTEPKPSFFEMGFVINSIKYKYGFSVSKNFVHSEWLFNTEKRKESKLFIRAEQNYSFDKKFKDGIKGKFELFAEVTRPNTLFLSVLSQFNNTLCQNISNWFSDLIFAHDTAHFNLIDSTASLMKSGEYRKMITEMIKRSDLGIESVNEKVKDAILCRISFKDFISSIKAGNDHVYEILTGHFLYNEKNEIVRQVYFDLFKNESLGTQKFFGILGPILFSLTQKRIIWIDEIDARVHSLLLENVISLFNSNKYNPNGAQLIFTSHNTTIMKKGLRRDQMIFIEKDKYGASTFESLHTKDPRIRNDASFDKDYLLGKYGSIPRLGTQLNLFDL